MEIVEYCTLWLVNIAMEAIALIEIDGLPINSMVILSWRSASHNQMVELPFGNWLTSP
jgi:hypothetical protein